MTIALVIFSVIFGLCFKYDKKDLQTRGQNEKLINNMNRYDNDREKKKTKWTVSEKLSCVARLYEVNSPGRCWSLYKV